jgi:hypothetical protein
MKIELRQVLKRELKARQMTINALARDCAMPVSVLHAWVQGVLPSAKNLHHIGTLAKFLNLPVSVLLFDEDERNPDATVLFNVSMNGLNPSPLGGIAVGAARLYSPPKNRRIWWRTIARARILCMTLSIISYGLPNIVTM